MKRLGIILISLLLVSCSGDSDATTGSGNTDSTPSSAGSSTPAAPPKNPEFEGEQEYEDCLASGRDPANCEEEADLRLNGGPPPLPARTAEDARLMMTDYQNDTWAELSRRDKLFLARIYLRDRKVPVVTPGDVLRGVKASGSAAPDELNSIRLVLEYGMRRAAYREVLGGRRTVGLTRKQLRFLLGSPDRKQNIGGQEFWYYTPLNDSLPTVQLVLSGDEVAQQNDY